MYIREWKILLLLREMNRRDSRNCRINRTFRRKEMRRFKRITRLKSIIGKLKSMRRRKELKSSSLSRRWKLEI